MPPINAKPVSLTVRPFQVSNLCFEVGGILGESFTELGSRVSAFDFAKFYNTLREANTHELRPDGRVSFDADGIDAQTKAPSIVGARPVALAALRAELVKAALNKAITTRANAVITRYGNATGIINNYRDILRKKTARIKALQARSENDASLLRQAYEKGIKIEEQAPFKGITLPPRPAVIAGTFSTVSAHSDSHTFEPVAEVSSTSKSETDDAQTIVNIGYEYRIPHSENDGRNERAQIALGDEELSNFMQSHYLDRMGEVLTNELALIDADIYQMQVAYLNTILMSPINGIVTGVYKNPGDPINPGEPVFRVENNADILVVAKVVCRGPISLGLVLQVKTTLFHKPGPHVVVIEAPIVAARGQGEDDQWEVIVKQPNLDAAGQSILPLGYSFDYDNTEVNIFGAG